jgi:hypothetical protein
MPDYCLRLRTVLPSILDRRGIIARGIIARGIIVRGTWHAASIFDLRSAEANGMSRRAAIESKAGRRYQCIVGRATRP